ncbi:MAG: twin-arginine translocase TatA/TatE family subunit [Gaiellaceae bacterium]
MVGLTSPTHLVLLLLIALLLFGAKRVPEIGRSLGHGMREFKDSVSSLGNEDPEPKPESLPLSASDDRPASVVAAVHENDREAA